MESASVETQNATIFYHQSEFTCDDMRIIIIIIKDMKILFSDISTISHCWKFFYLFHLLPQLTQLKFAKELSRTRSRGKISHSNKCRKANTQKNGEKFSHTPADMLSSSMLFLPYSPQNSHSSEYFPALPIIPMKEGITIDMLAEY